MINTIRSNWRQGRQKSIIVPPMLEASVWKFFQLVRSYLITQLRKKLRQDCLKYPIFNNIIVFLSLSRQAKKPCFYSHKNNRPLQLLFQSDCTYPILSFLQGVLQFAFPYLRVALYLDIIFLFSLTSLFIFYCVLNLFMLIVSVYIYIYIYTGYPRRKGQYSERSVYRPF